MCHGALASAAAAAAGRNRDGMGVWIGAEREIDKHGAQEELLGRLTGQGQRVEGSNFAVPLGSGSVKNFRSAISAHRGSAAADADSKPGAALRRTVRRRSPHRPNRSAAARACAGVLRMRPSRPRGQRACLLALVDAPTMHCGDSTAVGVCRGGGRMQRRPIESAATIQLPLKPSVLTVPLLSSCDPCENSQSFAAAAAERACDHSQRTRAHG